MVTDGIVITHQKTGISLGEGALMILALWKNFFLVFFSIKFWSLFF